jgi:hypothetical protein
MLRTNETCYSTKFIVGSKSETASNPKFVLLNMKFLQLML